jgi:signal transduction histidine kinase
MAEIATSVLHNVGNVLNSVNVSATVVADRLRHSDVPSLGQVSNLIAEHRADLGTFITADERGRMIPDFIAQLAGCLDEEQKVLTNEVASLTKGIDHIKQIVAAQQSMAKKSSVRTSVEPAKLLETALSLQAAASSRNVKIERDYQSLPKPVELDEHKVLQILVNLISNAAQAVAARGDATKQITLRIATRTDELGREWLSYSVADNGVGIAPENLARIFGHGFTTKQDGHGFGLHSAVNAAREMGGDLSVASEGVGRGATFTLEIPTVEVSSSLVQEPAPCQ